MNLGLYQNSSWPKVCLNSKRTLIRTLRVAAETERLKFDDNFWMMVTKMMSEITQEDNIISHHQDAKIRIKV